MQEGAKVSTVLKIDGGMMTLLRKGILEQEQRFEKGCEHTSIYRTPYGNIDLSVRTEALTVDYGEVAGRIDVRYGLWVNGAFQSQNRLHIEVEEVNEIAPEKSGKYRYVLSKVDASGASCAT